MKKNKFICFIILGVIVIGTLWCGSWLLIDYNIENSTNRGELGLIVTLLFQKEELGLQT